MYKYFEKTIICKMFKRNMLGYMYSYVNMIDLKRVKFLHFLNEFIYKVYLTQILGIYKLQRKKVLYLSLTQISPGHEHSLGVFATVFHNNVRVAYLC